MSSHSGRKSTVERRIQIKNAALEIIYAEGLKGLSSQNLSKHIHLSEGALYRHFESKKEIIYSIVEDVEEDLLNELKKIALADNSPEKRIKAFFCKHYNYLKSHKGVNTLLFSLASYKNDKQLKVALEHIFNSQKKYFCKIIMDGIVKKVWNESISSEYLSEIYMGIPIIYNIEYNLNSTSFKNNYFCIQMFTLIMKILEK